MRQVHERKRERERRRQKERKTKRGKERYMHAVSYMMMNVNMTCQTS